VAAAVIGAQNRKWEELLDAFSQKIREKKSPAFEKAGGILNIKYFKTSDSHPKQAKISEGLIQLPSFILTPIHAMSKRKQDEDNRPTADGSPVDDESSGDEVY
jgi:hypothetical protein